MLFENLSATALDQTKSAANATFISPSNFDVMLLFHLMLNRQQFFISM